MISLTVKVTNNFDKLTSAALKQVDKTVRKAAFDIEREAKLLAPVDTGFLRNSIYTVTAGKSGFKVSSANASGAAQRTLFNQVAVTNPYEAIVAVGAEYGIYLEYGTHKMRAQPYLIPAVQKVFPSFEKDLNKALEGK